MVAAAMALATIISAEVPAASVIFPVTAIAVTVTAPAVWVADSTGPGAPMCGAIGAPTMDPWFPPFELGPSRQLRVATSAGHSIVQTQFSDAGESHPMSDHERRS
jgi:hypothetical protein